MHIILSVLGTIAIILLKILFILFLFLCFLLFCPAFYKGRAEFGKTLLAKGRLCWLLGLVWVSFSYQEGEIACRLRLLGVDVQKVALWHEKRVRRKMLKKAARKKKRQAAGAEHGKEDEAEPHPAVKEDSLETGKPKGSFREEKKGKNRKFSKKRQKKRRRLYRRLKEKADWLKAAKKFWHSESTVRMVCILKDNVLHLWRKLKPKVLRGRVIFGTGDPCTTGQILGVAALFYAFYGNGIQIVPDFEEARLEGTLFVKGRISLITIVVILFRIFFCSEWSRFKQEAKQLKEAL